MDIEALTDEVEHVSRGYASCFDIQRDDTWSVLKLQQEVAELDQAHLMRTGQARTEGLSAEEIDEAFRFEVADVMAIRCCWPDTTGSTSRPRSRTNGSYGGTSHLDQRTPYPTSGRP